MLGLLIVYGVWDIWQDNIPLHKNKRWLKSVDAGIKALDIPPYPPVKNSITFENRLKALEAIKNTDQENN